MKNMNKVVYVPAHKAPLFKTVVKKEFTGETKTDIFGREIKLTRGVSKKVLSGYSDSKIDGQGLSEDIQKAVDTLNKDGYEVICISEVTSAYGNSAYGYGYSYTEGVNIIAKKVV
jgi:pantoate kinase